MMELEILKNLEDKSIKVLYQDKNYGKGKALSTAFKENLKEIVIIQDADLEYDPNDYDQLLEPFSKTNAEVVYGSRFLGTNKYIRLHFFWHSVANKILTLFAT